MAFQQLKQELLQAHILSYSDNTLPFIVYTDASNRGLGTVLAQEQDGFEWVIAYSSRSLHPPERNDYDSSFKLEFLAMKWAIVEKFKDHLWGAKITVVTDNNPLVHLQTASLGLQSKDRLHNWPITSSDRTTSMVMFSVGSLLSPQALVKLESGQRQGNL